MDYVITMLKSIDLKTWLVIGVIVYMIATGKIDPWAILRPTPAPAPGPTPAPGPAPAPTPGPMDWNTLMQLMFHLFLKAEATGNAELKQSVAVIASHIDMPLTNVPPAATFTSTK